MAEWGKTADIKAEICNVLYSHSAIGAKGSDRLKTNKMDLGRTVRLLAEIVLFCKTLKNFQNLRTHLEIISNSRNWAHGKNRREVILGNTISKSLILFILICLRGL